MWDPANHAGYRSYYDASPTSFYDSGLTAGTMEKLHLSLNMDWPGPPPLMLLSSPPRSQPKSPLLRPKSPLRSDVVSRRGSMLPTVYEHHQDGESGVWESEDGSQKRQSQTQMQVDKEEENQGTSKENDDGCVRGKEKGKGKEKETLRVS
ncbi:hypothetical protein AMATHDRAFT_48997 [Amanita thiersii Skay4041]|uniref:Uncharacterized protein n=1 Tax=Amanita thiersii Skay4041 TaxID=703135 RepID=A0A2A9NIB6_9AGAR|nr:hypothetical protein AMATHDRAFT_48997 [Amanita thiersii Skay4041]